MPFLRKRLRILKARTARMPVEKVYGTKIVIQKERPGWRIRFFYTFIKILSQFEHNYTIIYFTERTTEKQLQMKGDILWIISTVIIHRNRMI